MKLLLPIFIGSVFLASFSSEAEVNVVSQNPKLSICNTCTSYLSFSSKALESPPSAGVQVRKVLNIKTGEIKTFQISVEKEPGVQTLIFANEIPSSTSDLQRASEAKTNAENLNSAMAEMVVPSSVLPNSVALVGNSSNLTKLQNYINDNSSTTYFLEKLFGVILLSTGIPPESFYVSTEIGFGDGSKALLKIVNKSSNNNFTVVLIQVVDKNGNIIPLNQAEFNERKNDVYYFNDQSGFDQFVRLAFQYGIRFVNVSSSSFGGGGTVTIIDCGSGGCSTTKKGK